MKIILALFALAALSFEIYQALHHLHDEPVSGTWAYYIGGLLTVAACGFAAADMWHHFRHVREPDARDAISITLILSGLAALPVSFVAFYGAGIFFRTFLTWPLWAAAAGIASIGMGALLSVRRDYKASEIDLFGWARQKAEEKERKKRVKAAYEVERERAEYYKKNPEMIPPRIPNLSSRDKKYIV